MFKRSHKSQYVQPAVSPLSISGTNNSPYMQDMLKAEEKRRRKQSEEAYNRRNGYIK